MKINHEKKRLDAIKLRYAFFPKKCGCCGEEYVSEKMYKVRRWGVNKMVFTWHYCQNCMKSKEDVIHEIDTDSNFGIAFVDNFGDYPEKDDTKMREPLPDPTGT